MNQREKLTRLATRTRQALEELLTSRPDDGSAKPKPESAATYTAAVRIIMRLIVIRFAESRNLLPAGNQAYDDSYGLAGLHRLLADLALRDRNQLSGRGFAWARVLSLFRLVYFGASHPQMPVRAYGGELFEPGDPASENPVSRVMALWERPDGGPDDLAVLRILDLLCRSGKPDRSRTRGDWVNFRTLSTEYIGSLYEGLLDYEISSGSPTLVRRRAARKGGGVFYTPADLARGTVERTLHPLCHEAGAVPAPLPPERLLALRVVDPAMGSGTFLVAALAYLTGVLAESLKHHGRLAQASSGTKVNLGPHNRFILPGKPGEPAFDSLLIAHLKRRVVDFNLYGVDIDPLTVELARISLWLETMDRRLPFTFLDHKLKVGNSLVGTWQEDVGIYPIRAWRRPGETRTPDSGQPLHLLGSGEQVAAGQLKGLLAEAAAPVLPLPGLQQRLGTMRGELARLMRTINRQPVELPDRKRKLYRKDYLQSHRLMEAHAVLDRWCALWFWPPERLHCAPMPVDYYQPDGPTDPTIGDVAKHHKFLHWELAFPDVFGGRRPGFDAVVGNPPWEVCKPNAREFGMETAGLIDIPAWQQHCRQFRELSNWFSHRNQPGGPFDDRLRRAVGTAGRKTPASQRPFVHQGTGDLNTYKLFIEQALRVCRSRGRLGLIVPAGIYSDQGSSELRKLLLGKCRWEWLLGFQNRRRIFPIDSRFKFAAIVAQKGGRTRFVSTRFEQTSVDAWDLAQNQAFEYPVNMLHRLSPESCSFIEATGKSKLNTLDKIHRGSNTLGAPDADWRCRYVREFDAGNSNDRFQPVEWWRERGYEPAATGVWRSVTDPDRPALPVVHGAAVSQFRLVMRPRFLMAADTYVSSGRAVRGTKLAIRRITNATNSRTLMACLVPDLPCTDKAAVLALDDPEEALAMLCLLNSFAADYVARCLCGGANLDKHHLFRIPLPGRDAPGLMDHLPLLGLVLGSCHPLFAELWMEMRERRPLLANRAWREWWTVSDAQRTRLRAATDALVAKLYGLGREELEIILKDCDHSAAQLKNLQRGGTLNPTGFWRVDRDRLPQQRHTLMTLSAFTRLERLGVSDFVQTEMGTPANPASEAGWEECRQLAERFKDERERWSAGLEDPKQVLSDVRYELL